MNRFECYRIGDLLLDAGTQELSRDGVTLPIPRLSFKLLLSLARHAPNVVSVQTLEKEVWNGLVVDRGTVNKRVLLLRKSLDEHNREEPYIAVVRGSGYRLLEPVERLSGIPGEAAPRRKRTEWYQHSAGVVRVVSYWLLGVVALVALYQGVKDMVQRDGESTSVSVPGARSIAVLPFVDMSDDQTYQYLGDGVAEEIINLLVKMNGMQVAARTSSFALRDSGKTAREIGAELHVGAILEGSVRQTGNDLRVSAQLIDTRSGYDIWSKDYDRPFDELFSVQDDIALNIAQTLKLSLDAGNKPDSVKVATTNVEAFALYLKGRSLLNDRIHLRAEGLREALGVFRQAVAEAPTFARAHAGVAACLALLPSYDNALDSRAYMQDALESASFALEINPDAADALGVMAFIHSHRGELQQAADLFQRLETLGSKDPNNIHWRALMMMRLGYFDELLAGLQSTYRHDPLNQHIGWSLATVLNFAGRSSEASAILKPLEDFTFRDYTLALAAINQGDYAQARSLLRGTRLRSGILPADSADLLVDAIEHPAMAQVSANEVIASVVRGALDRQVGFEVLLIMGTPRVYDFGMDIVNDIGNQQILTQIWNNWSVALRQDPRFKDWMRELGYLDFWRKHGWPDRCRPTRAGDFECI